MANITKNVPIAYLEESDGDDSNSDSTLTFSGDESHLESSSTDDENYDLTACD